MWKYLMIVATWAAVSLVSAADSEATGPVKVALLPVRQTPTRQSPGLSDEKLSAAIHVEFTKAADFQLVEFAEFQEQAQNQLVEDALFELLVTDDLAQTLQRLAALDTDAGRRQAYAHAARQLQIQYLAEVTLTEQRDRTEVYYQLKDPVESRVVLARSFGHPSRDAGGVARETARLKGEQAQAEKLNPVVNSLTMLIGEAREPKGAQTATSVPANSPLLGTAPVSDVLAQSDFQTLLKAVKNTGPTTPTNTGNALPWRTSSPLERNQVVIAMADGGMNDVDIARQMGMTRDEVRLVLSAGQR